MSFVSLTLNSRDCFERRPARVRLGETEAVFAAMALGFAAASGVVLSALTAAFG